MFTGHTEGSNLIVVLGLGNYLLTDEGVGIHALRLLERMVGSRAEIRFIDGGVLGLDLLHLVEATNYLLILDALDADLPAGSIVELANEQIPLYQDIKLSEHQISFQEVLGIAHFRERLPAHLHLIGIQPENTSLGIGLSDPVRASLVEVPQRAQVVLDQWCD